MGVEERAVVCSVGEWHYRTGMVCGGQSKGGEDEQSRVPELRDASRHGCVLRGYDLRCSCVFE